MELALLKTRGLDWEGDVVVEVKGKSQVIPVGTALAASKGVEIDKSLDVKGGSVSSTVTTAATASQPPTVIPDERSSSIALGSTNGIAKLYCSSNVIFSFFFYY